MYLRNTGFLAAPLARIFENAQGIDNEKYAVSISSKIAEQLRSAFTDRLAKVGFDANYELTSEGRMLEELIDRFHMLR